MPSRPPYRAPSFILDVFDAVKRGDAMVTNWSQSQGGILGITTVSIDIDMLGMPLPHQQPSGSQSAVSSMASVPPPSTLVPRNARMSKSFSFLWDDETDVPAIQDIGTGTQCVVGYRDFMFAPSTLALYSRNGALWPKYEHMRGICHPGQVGKGYERATRFRHDAPDDDCSCGIYAFDNLTHEDMQTNAQVYGEINMWGKVLLCETGFRAEYAYPKTLFVVNEASPKTAEWIAETLEGEYGVPTHVVATRGMTHSQVMDEAIKGLLTKPEEGDES